MSATNVSLSKEELSLVCDSSWIRMKTGIIQKVYELFAASVDDINNCFAEKGVFDIYAANPTSPKISKGENYLELPYVVLDYPRDFGKKDVFSLRTFFWWGSFFSINLHLSGRYKETFLRQYAKGKQIPEEFYFCLNESPWHHYFENDNLMPIYSPEAVKHMAEMENLSFLKFSLRFDLDEWNKMQILLRQGYQKMAGLLV